MKEVRKAWIIAGDLDGRAALPDALETVAGMPHLLRHACAAKAAGVKQIYIIWKGPLAAPDITALSTDDRLQGIKLDLITSVPPGQDDDRILILRADRIFHRDLPKRVAERAAHTATVVKIRGDEYDSVLAMNYREAVTLVSESNLSEAINRLLEQGPCEQVTPPWLGFSVHITNECSKQKAEKLLVYSLRKAADGFAATYINRHISLLITRILARTPIRPNHVTFVCLLLAMSGGLFIAQGDYWGGVIGFLFIEAASVFDGIDGELSRLSYRFSRMGQWMDTVVDDVSNVIFVAATTYALYNAEVLWALPLGVTALAAFTATQAIQYYFIIKVYHSGDLAAIPWAFQSTDFLESRPKKLVPWLKWAVPRCLKRDFVVTLFVLLALLGRLDFILIIWAAGALSFLIVFLFQMTRYVMGKSNSAA